MIDRRYFRYFDWFSFFVMLVMMGLGLLFVFSSTYSPEKPISLFFKKQLFGMVSGLCIYFFFCIKDLRNVARIGFFLYFGILLLLFYTIISGWTAMGAKRWVSLYFFRFQPSDLAKLFLPVFIASYFGDEQVGATQVQEFRSFKRFLFPLAVLFLSFILVVKQPDLGTGLIILLSGFILLWLLGLSKRFFLISGLCFILGAPLLWTLLKPYQQKRILVLLGYGDLKKERYQVEQSKIAIGSGGLYGKGLLQGTQNKLNFLPEDHTDFIFSVICEEWGFIGALIVIFLFLCLFVRLIFIIYHIPSLFDQVVGLGMLIHLLLSVCINIGMVIGILPIVGIPLPLFSYGLTNLWITFISLGWLNNIAIRRFYY